MKNACKRLFSLMLAVVLLVSLVPFQASADTTDSFKVIVRHEVDGKITFEEQHFVSPSKGDSSVVSNVIKYYVDREWNEVGEGNIVIHISGEPAYYGDDLSQTVSVGQILTVKYVSNTGKGDEGNKDEGNKDEGNKPAPVAPISIVVKVNNSDNVVAELTHTPKNGEFSVVEDLLSYIWKSNWDAKYTFDHAWIKGQGEVGKDAEVPAGGTVHIMLNEKKNTTTPPTTDSDVEDIHVVIKVNKSDKVVKELDVTPANGEYSLIKNLLSYKWNSAWDGVYEFDHAWVKSTGKTTTNKDAKVMAGDEVHIMLKELKSNSGNGSNGSGNGSVGKEFLKDAKLNIYYKGHFDAPAKQVTIGEKGQAGYDGDISLEDVKEIVRKYFSAKDSDGIGYDGIYILEGNTVDKWQLDDKQEEIDNLNELRADRTIYLGVWIDNAKAKTTSNSNADKSNPKTGDEIFMTVTVMAVSAVALTGAYVFNKKRMVK